MSYELWRWNLTVKLKVNVASYVFTKWKKIVRNIKTIKITNK